jgi:hypothetical protein
MEIRTRSDAIASKAQGAEAKSTNGQHNCVASRARNPSLTVYLVEHRKRLSHYCMRHLYVPMAHVKDKFDGDVF